MAVKLIKTEQDERAQSRYHVNMIMGERSVLIEDNKWKKLTGMVRSMNLDVDEIISESTYEQIFADVVEALHQSGNMSDDEMASCITFPAGTKVYANEVKQA
jgi:predicted DNA-binding ribbon-helix-helix protein